MSTLSPVNVPQSLENKLVMATIEHKTQVALAELLESRRELNSAYIRVPVTSRFNLDLAQAFVNLASFGFRDYMALLNGMSTQIGPDNYVELDRFYYLQNTLLSQLEDAKIWFDTYTRRIGKLRATETIEAFATAFPGAFDVASMNAEVDAHLVAIEDLTK